MIIKAKKSDLDQIMEILITTVEEMKSYNNTQWDESYPQAKDFTADIEKEDLYVEKDGQKIKGFICINYTEPSEYKDLSWSSHKKCMVIHRMAVNLNYRNQGVGTNLIKFAEDLALENGIDYLKSDTYSINKNMNAMFKKFSFKLVGEMNFLGKEKPFYCYEKIISNNIL